MNIESVGIDRRPSHIQAIYSEDLGKGFKLRKISVELCVGDREFQFQGKGKIVSHTIIRTAPEGFEINAPYAIAMIKLEEGPTITGQVIGNIKDVAAGKKVKTVFRKMYEDGPDGQIFYGLKWEITS